MTTNLKERFEEKFSNVGWIPSEKGRILAFIKAELESLADEILRNGHTPDDAAAIIRNRAGEIIVDK